MSENGASDELVDLIAQAVRTSLHDGGYLNDADAEDDVVWMGIHDAALAVVKNLSAAGFKVVRDAD